MRIRTLDFTRLTERLLAPRRFVELVPAGFIDDGRGMRLAPARNGVALDLEHIHLDSLPTLNFEEAGIDAAREPDSGERAVTALLKGHSFELELNIDLIPALSLVPTLLEALELQSTYMKVKRMQVFSVNTPLDLEEEMQKFFDSYSRMLRLTIVPCDGPFKGLGLEKPIEGYMISILGLIYSSQDFEQQSPETKAVRACLRFLTASTKLKEVRAIRQTCHARNSKKWWFRLFGVRKRWYEILLSERAAVATARLEAESTLAALPA